MVLQASVFVVWLAEVLHWSSFPSSHSSGSGVSSSSNVSEGEVGEKSRLP